MAKYNVYEYYNTENDYIFYVGKGTLKRVHEIDPSRRNKRFIDYINANKSFDVRIIFSSDNEDECLKIEQDRIACLRAENQANCNLSSTSFGLPGNDWYKHLTEEEKERINKINSNSKKGKNNGMYGKKGENCLNGRKYYAYDENWNLVKTFNSFTHVKDFLNIRHHSTLLLAIKKERMYKGYYWKKEI